MTFQKWLFTFLYLLMSCTLALNILAILAFSAIRLFLLIFYDVPFEMEPIDLIKYAKAASFAGSLVAIGRWWIYYQRYRPGRNR